MKFICMPMHPQSNPHVILHLFAPLLNTLYSLVTISSAKCTQTGNGAAASRQIWLYNRIANVTEMLHHLKWTLWRLGEITFALYYYIKSLTNWWTSLQWSNWCLQIVSQEAIHKDTFSYQPKLMLTNIPFPPLLLEYGIVYLYTLSVLKH